MLNYNEVKINESIENKEITHQNRLKYTMKNEYSWKNNNTYIRKSNSIEFLD